MVRVIKIPERCDVEMQGGFAFGRIKDVGASVQETLQHSIVGKQIRNPRREFEMAAADIIKMTTCGPLEIATFPCRSDNYGYLMRDGASGAVAAIDAPEAAQIKAALDHLGWKLTHILLTHHHGDHVEGVEALRGLGDVQVVGAAADATRLPKLDMALAAGKPWHFGDHEVAIIDTPGHTVGHIVYHLPGPKVLFSGDTLFAMGCGRLFEGTALQMWGGLSALKALPDDTTVFFGHEYTAANGDFSLNIESENPELLSRISDVTTTLSSGGYTSPTTLGLEKKTNPFLRADSAAVARAVEMVGADAPIVFAEVRRRKDQA